MDDWERGIRDEPKSHKLAIFLLTSKLGDVAEEISNHESALVTLRTEREEINRSISALRNGEE